MTVLLPAERRRASSHWRRGLLVQLRVIHALMLRDALKAHGHHGLGFFWIIGEPLFLMIAVMVMWTFTHVGHGTSVGVIPFALTGYSFLTLWRHICSRSILIMRRNLSLLHHRHINLLDVMLAMTALESVALLTAFSVCYVPFYLLGYCPLMRDPLEFVGGFAMAAWFSFGVGLILASTTEISDMVRNVVGAIMYITLPLTGAFTMQDWLPQQARVVLSWSPLVNCVEMIRGGVFPSDIVTHWSLSFLLVVNTTLSIIGLALFHWSRAFAQD